nr:NADH dehydrogenase subunit 4 [Megaginus tataupensis]
MFSVFGFFLILLVNFTPELMVSALLSSSIVIISQGWDMMSWGFNMDQLSVLLTFLSLMVSSIILMLCSKNKMNKMPVIILLMSIIISLFFLTDSLMWFFILFEVSLIPLMLMMMLWGKQAERISAVQYILLYTFVGSSPLLFSLIYLIKESGMTSMSTSVFLMIEESSLYFSLMLTSFLVKIPVYFFHSWLPKAHVEAPLEGSMILAGLMLKLGMYGLIRVLSIVQINDQMISLIFSISVVGSLISTLIALSVDDMKMSVAFSSISHMNVIVASVLSMKVSGLYSSMIIMFSHGLSSPILFFIVTKIYNISNSRSALISKGSMSSFPLFTLIALVSWVINLSTPPFFSFTGEVLSFLSTISYFPVLIFWITIYMGLSSFFCVVNYGVHCHSSKKLHMKTNLIDFPFILCFSLVLFFMLILFFFQPI